MAFGAGIDSGGGGGSLGSTVEIAEIETLADGTIIVGDGSGAPTTLAAFTSGTGTLKHESGGVEANISAIADGGVVVGTGAGTMAIRASVLTGGAAGFIKHELGGLEADVSAYDGLVRITGGATAAVTVTTAALTILDDTTVGAMVDTLGGATAVGTGGLARATSPTFTTSVVMADEANVVLSTTTGTKIGTGTTQKLGFWNVTPVVQPATVGSPAGGITQDAEARTAIDALRARLIDCGIISA